MPSLHALRFGPIWAMLFLVLHAGAATAQRAPDVSLKPDDKPGAAGKPIKVFILMGQSNMVVWGISAQR